MFDDVVRDVVRPSTRTGQLHRLLASLEHAVPRARTRFAAPLEHLQGLVRRRGIIVLLSDLYEQPQAIVRAVEPLAFRGNEVVLFHVLDPEELRPQLGPAAVLVDLETQERLDVTAEYAQGEYRERIERHVEELRRLARGAGIGYQLLTTDAPLDGALREYLAVRTGRD